MDIFSLYSSVTNKEMSSSYFRLHVSSAFSKLEPDKLLKVHLHDIFVLNWFGQKKPSKLLIIHLNYFWIWLRIKRDIQIFMHSGYSQHVDSFIPRILAIQNVSFCAFSVSDSFILHILRNKQWRCKILETFCVFSVYEMFPSADSQYIDSYITTHSRYMLNSLYLLSTYIKFHTASYPETKFFLRLSRNFPYSQWMHSIH